MRRKARTVKRSWRGSKTGIAGAVTAVLFVIIITTILTTTALYFVPVWSKQAESEHMSRVNNEFMSLQDGVRDQITAGESASSLYSHIVMTSGATNSFLGIKGEPSQGTLIFDPNQSAFDLHDTDSPAEIFAMAKGRLTFQSHNNFYIQQEYVYENGAVIIGQGTCSTVRDAVAPEIHRNEYGCLTLLVNFFSLFGDSSYITGSGSAGVETRVLHTEQAELPLPGGKNITYNGTTKYGAGWARYINSTLVSNMGAWNFTSSNYTVSWNSNGYKLNVKDVWAITIRFAVIEMKVSR
jgi:hypothetical protein